VNPRRNYVFLDMDGTLVDSLQPLYDLYISFLADRGREGTRDEFAVLNGPSFPEIVLYLKKTHSLEEAEEQLLAAYNERLEAVYAEKVAPRQGASEALEELKKRGFGLMLVTSTRVGLVNPLLKRTGWGDLLDGAITGDLVVKAKPSPEIYKLAIAKSGTSPDKIVAVEDSPNGVRAAYGAGLCVIGLPIDSPAEELFQAGAAHSIDSLFDLPDMAHRILQQ